MSNIGISYVNLIDDATLTSINSSDWTSQAPLSFLQDTMISRRAQSSDLDASKTIVNFDLGDAETVGVFGIIYFNASVTAKVRLVLSATSDFDGYGEDISGSTIDYDTGYVDVWPSVITVVNVEWENDEFWFGRVDQKLVAAYGQPNWIHVVNSGTAVSARYGRLFISDESNDESRIKIGRLWCGPLFQPEINFISGASLGWVPQTKVKRGSGGSKSVQKKRMYRTFTFTFDALSNAEGYETLDMKRVLDLDGQVLIVADYEDEVNGFRRNFLGIQRQVDPLSYPYTVDIYGTTFQIDEDI